jgi:hypothetical protein
MHRNTSLSCRHCTGNEVEEPMDGAAQHAVPGQMRLASPINGICRPTITVERYFAVLLALVELTAYPK